MNDEHANPPPEDQEDQSEPNQLPKSEEEIRDALKAIYDNQKSPEGSEVGREPSSTPPVEYEQDILTSGEDLRDAVADGKLPRSEEELRLIVREIVSEVLEDVNELRRAVSEPVDVVTIPQLMIPRIRLSPMQILSAVVAVVILIGGPITWAAWPRNAEIPDGAVGLWTTVSPDYADVAFRVTKNTLTFHVSPTDSTFHPIVRVRTEENQEERAIRYSVVYTHYMDEYEFHFLYREEPDTTIRFVNQKEMTWRKSRS